MSDSNWFINGTQGGGIAESRLDGTWEWSLIHSGYLQTGGKYAVGVHGGGGMIGWKGIQARKCISKKREKTKTEERKRREKSKQKGVGRVATPEIYPVAVRGGEFNVEKGNAPAIRKNAWARGRRETEIEKKRREKWGSQRDHDLKF